MQLTRTLRPLAITVAGVALTLAACGGGSDSAATTDAPAPAATDAAPAGTDASPAPAAATGDAAITIASFSFSGITEVPAGTTVTITNNDSAPHTLTADDGSFDTGGIGPGESVTLTFDTAGTFTFHCEIHSSMKGSITVT